MASGWMFLLAACFAQAIAVGGPLLAEVRDFEGEWQEAEKKALRGPDRGYAEMVLKEFPGKGWKHIDACVKKTGTPMGERLRALVDLGPAGEVREVLVEPKTTTTECYAELTKKDRFTRPPRLQVFRVPVEFLMVELPRAAEEAR